MTAGRVWRGNLSAARGADTGDALLMDFGTGLFAVADAPERSPGAGVRFLERISGTFREGVAPVGAGKTWGEATVRMILLAESALRETPRDESCAFSGVWIGREKGAPRALLLHAGDSALWQLDASSGRARELSRPNFWMVGRTTRFFQAEEVPIEPGRVLVLGTDGFAERFLDGRPGREALLKGFVRTQPTEIVSELARATAPAHSEGDDAAAIFLIPEGLAQAGEVVMLRRPGNEPTGE